MKQQLKNQYYSLLENKDYQTLQLVNTIFTKIDTLILTERGKNHQKEFLDLISVLEFTEIPLYHKMSEDIRNGVF